MIICAQEVRAVSRLAAVDVHEALYAPSAQLHLQTTRELTHDYPVRIDAVDTHIHAQDRTQEQHLNPIYG